MANIRTRRHKSQVFGGSGFKREIARINLIRHVRYVTRPHGPNDDVVADDGLDLILAGSGFLVIIVWLRRRMFSFVMPGCEYYGRVWL